jgi:hypothetical protein
MHTPCASAGSSCSCQQAAYACSAQTLCLEPCCMTNCLLHCSACSYEVLSVPDYATTASDAVASCSLYSVTHTDGSEPVSTLHYTQRFKAQPSSLHHARAWPTQASCRQEQLPGDAATSSPAPCGTCRSSRGTPAANSMCLSHAIANVACPELRCTLTKATNQVGPKPVSTLHCNSIAQHLV